MATLPGSWASVKPFQYYLLALVVVGFAAAYLSRTKKIDPALNSRNPAFSTYISGHSSGVISRDAAIRIQLASAFHDSLHPQAIPADLFEIEPEIDGKIRWTDASTIEFVPDKWLPTGTEFQVRFHLSKLMMVPVEFSDFVFTFQTIPQSFEMTEPLMEAIDPTSLIYQRISGEFASADVELPQTIESIFSATHEGKNIRVKWEHQPDNRSHRFTLDSLVRKESETSVRIAWNGEKAGVQKSGEKEINIPALGDFKVMAALVADGEDQHISVRFSDPLLPDQNLEGLIYLNNMGQNEFRFTIDRNEVRVYPQSHIIGTQVLRVETGIQNIMGYKMPKEFETQLTFADVLPSVRILGKGVIIPNSAQLVLPFEAVNLKAVDVTIIKIFENNVDQFLQINTLDGSYELKRVGRPLARKTVRLDDNKLLDLHRPNRFALDLSTIIKTEPGAIYNVKFSFRPGYSLYRCQNDTSNVFGKQEVEEGNLESLENEYDQAAQNQYEYDEEYYGEDYDWDERDNPCSKSYFNSSRWVARNVMASDLGIIAKQGTDGELFFAVTDLRSTETQGEISLEVYDYQKQLVGKAVTSSDGTARIKPKHKAFLLIAKKGKQRGYLRLDDGSSLSLSRFDIGGEEVQKGIKGFIYGERGVWRPGDSLFTMFLLDDRLSPLPLGHPVTFELFTPQGQLYKRMVNNRQVNGFYNFHTFTSSDAPTGSWIAKVKAGGATFTKTIRIETVQPNRLKINLGFAKTSIRKSEPLKSTLRSTWLHGAPARNLDATVEASFSKTTTTFPKYETYVFDDPSRDFSAESEKIFEGKLDENGTAEVEHPFDVGEKAPGMINVNLLTKVFETGGNYSIDRFTIPYHPYDSYIGIKTPESKGYRQELETDTSHNISIVALDPDGKLVAESKWVKVTLYRMDWRFWWDRTYDDLSSYSEESYHNPIQTSDVQLINGKGNWKLRIDYPNWGRYLLKVQDVAGGGHSTGKVLYIDWPSEYGRAPKDGANEAAYLNFTSTKPGYKVGEDVVLNIPTGKEGRALISVESGTKVIETYWTDVTQGNTKFSFKATSAMLPNVFVHVSLLQPHAQTNNNLPIRMYGVVPVLVEDPTTILQPQIKAPASMRPEEISKIQVSEATGKPMTYTLALVDEGLLDLTRFKTPDPHAHFYAREALGVKTWDLYDYVMGAFGVSMDRILSIGGDEGMNKKGGAKKANRFKPVVKFLGPFTLEKGASATHAIKLPPYVGSVRLMVVAAQQGAYGFSEKAVPVKKPLMVLATLPRMLAMREEVNIPVTVFAMEKSIRNVNVQIESNNLLEISGPATKAISFTEIGDQVVNFRLKSKNLNGIGKVKVKVSSGSETSYYDVELDIRNPNPYVTEVKEGSIAAGSVWNSSFKPPGTPGTNTASLEVSSLPPLNLEKRLEYLIHYPYGCVEQTTSSVFPQLALGDLLDLSPGRISEIDRNIKAGIHRLKGFQQSNGGLSYWPGGNLNADDWGSSYAGHFMVEAQNKGYALPLNFLSSWKAYQRSQASQWSVTDNKSSQLMQAYRLYTLALARDPEMGPMNRLKEQKNLSTATRWTLAAAYALAGQKSTALDLTKGLPLSMDPYVEYGYTYGSDLRDEAFILTTLTATGQDFRAHEMLKRISGKLGSSRWYSTQSTAMALIAVARYSGKSQKDKTLAFEYKIGSGKNQKFTGNRSVCLIPVPVGSLAAIPVQVRNTSGKQLLFTRIVSRGQPEQGDNSSLNNNVNLQVRYLDNQKKEINVTSLEQGTEFMAEVTVTHTGVFSDDYLQMAINQVFPAGWEIRNTRMEGSLLPANASVPDYEDVRDDRVYTFFDLPYRKSKTFYMLLHAAYIGNYILPSVTTEAMYNGDVFARNGGFRVSVTPRKPKA